jgi:hypothetical protein
MSVGALLENGALGEILENDGQSLKIRLFSGPVLILPCSEVWVLT